MGYRLFSDMTADVSDELMAGMPTVEFVPMQVEVGEESYTYGPEGDLTVEYFTLSSAGVSSPAPRESTRWSIGSALRRR